MGNNKPKSGKVRSWAELDGSFTCCGAKEHKAAQCPRKSSICNKCGRKGHLCPLSRSGVPYLERDKAPSLPARAFQVMKSTSSAEHSEEPETTVQSASGSRATPRINVHIRSPRNVQFHFRDIPDIGATRTMLSLDLVQRHSLDLESAHDTVTAANGDQMSVAGRVVLKLPVNGRTAYADCLLSACMRNCMLVSWHNLQNLGVIGSTFPLVASKEINATAEASSEVKGRTQDLRRQFMTSFRIHWPLIGPIVGKPIHIKLAENAVPYHANTSCPIPLHYQEEADATIKRLLHSGRIFRVKEATTWCARAHFFPKEGGSWGQKLLTSSLLVKPFDEKLKTLLLSDASTLHGLGFMLMQKEKNGRPPVVQCGSFSLTAVQGNYAAIELKCLAILRAVHKCEFYLRGC
ncbi:hypothetical protein TCAL_17446 [Tigriopus californicus]|uniref:Reverse transcriptase/retrotransposon-derived protein RNase H-like domain-containing protein n=1 Tax=Tigriopus californicus TaxID=6832 RepID=A0A553PSV2_TIGCA|nr:hypothetical protein TCAL_17446 [Tigriopus californicus]|eukprot:TCALIF_13354-PA protein Name:"Protein of unknown function" AED:0.07 eAED:0.10 QI:0/0/0/1/1/1/3/0/404